MSDPTNPPDDDSEPTPADETAPQGAPADHSRESGGPLLLNINVSGHLFSDPAPPPADPATDINPSIDATADALRLAMEEARALAARGAADVDRSVDALRDALAEGGAKVAEPGAVDRLAMVDRWRFVVDGIERTVDVARRAIGSVAATFDGHDATAEADDIAVNLLARRLRKAGRDVVVLAPGTVRK